MNTFVNPLTTYHFLGGDVIVGSLLDRLLELGVYVSALAIAVAAAMALVELIEFLDNWQFERNMRRDRISRFRAYKGIGQVQQRRRAVFGRLERKG
jgi:hypothetical protein